MLFACHAMFTQCLCSIHLSLCYTQCINVTVNYVTCDEELLFVVCGYIFFMHIVFLYYASVVGVWLLPV